MSNCKHTLMDVALAMRFKRRVAQLELESKPWWTPPQAPEPQPAPIFPSTPFEMRSCPLPTYTRCKHGLYDQTLCEHCLGTGISKPFETVTDEDEPQAPEVAELLAEEPVPVAGVDDPEEDRGEVAEESEGEEDSAFAAYATSDEEE